MNGRPEDDRNKVEACCHRIGRITMNSNSCVDGVQYHLLSKLQGQNNAKEKNVLGP